jgi:hypothetical protein
MVNILWPSCTRVELLCFQACRDFENVWKMLAKWSDSLPERRYSCWLIVSILLPVSWEPWSCKYKVNVKFYPYLNKHRSIKRHGEMEVKLHTLLTSVLDGDKWSMSCSFSFTHDKTISGISCRGGSVGRSSGLCIKGDSECASKYLNQSGWLSVVLKGELADKAMLWVNYSVRSSYKFKCVWLVHKYEWND